MTPVMTDPEYSLVAQNDVASGLINAIYANGAEFVKPEELVRLRDLPVERRFAWRYARRYEILRAERRLRAYVRIRATVEDAPVHASSRLWI